MMQKEDPLEKIRRDRLYVGDPKINNIYAVAYTTLENFLKDAQPTSIQEDIEKERANKTTLILPEEIRNLSRLGNNYL